MKSRKNLIMIALVVLVSVVGLSYAFFNYYMVSERNLQLITGEIYLRLDDGTEQVLLTNAFPETVEEARSRDDNYVTFSIVGKNTTTNKDIWYEIMLNEGEAVEGKKRLDLSDLRFDLSEVADDDTETFLIENMSFDDFNARRIWVDTVNRNTTEELERKYKLRVWLREDILISDTDPNATYTTGEYANNYMSVKVSVFGDLSEKDNPFKKHYMAQLGTDLFVFWPDEINSEKANISEVSFVQMTSDEMEKSYNEATIKADVSADENSNVKAWLEQDPIDTTKYLMKVASSGITVFPEYCSAMFMGFSSKTIVFNNIDTSQVTDMKMMFSACDGITSLDLSMFNTSQVTNMEMMFMLSINLQSVDLSSFDTRQVTNMRLMFRTCGSLNKLDLSKFDTSQVTNMSTMFYECASLTSLDLSSFNTSKVTSMEGMFQGCSNLTDLNVTSFDTSQVTTMNQMFNGCSSIERLDLSSFNTSQVTLFGSMFYLCDNLSYLDISNFTFAQLDSSFFNQSDDYIPLILVKSQTEQNSILSIGPSSWNTDNVVIKTA